ncbi:polymer-forming cytoskeletal protein [Kitasatospora sp. NPDC058063]|uniref:polymer-forming cytoskeletal protein n=1 Tax=unclassified Kitasatospora TaxID=2633591 RepID=UPI0036D76EB2
MFVRAVGSPTTALIYLVTTTPSPLEITPDGGTPTPAKISITAANPDPTDPIRITSLTFTLLVGGDAGQLTQHPEQIATTASPSADWTFTNRKDGTFTATPTSDAGYVEVTDKGLLFELTDIAVNGELGVTTLDIAEKTASGHGKTEFDLGKCLPAFQFGDLLPAFLDDGRTTVTNGQTVTLTWTASHGATYTMLHENTSHDVTNVRTWTTPAPLHRDATFHLRASLTTDGHTVTHYQHTSVTVDKPDLALQTLAVDGDVQVSGQTDVQGLHCAQTLEVGGEIHVAGTVYGGDRTEPVILYGAHVTSGLTVDGDLNATGAGTFGKDLATTGGLTVSEALTAGGTATVAGDLTANSAVTVKGGLTADGGATINESLYVGAVTDMLANHYTYPYPKAASFSRTAPTDGLLTVLLLIEDNTGKDQNIGLLARLTLQVGNDTYLVDAPILRQSGKSGQRHPMSVLVRKGQTISGTLANVDGDVDMDKMTTTLHWFPIGKSLELADG